MKELLFDTENCSIASVSRKMDNGYSIYSVRGNTPFWGN